jgi:glutathione S-transferase
VDIAEKAAILTTQDGRYRPRPRRFQGGNGMKFFWAQNTCAIGIRVILEELGLDYEPLKIDFASKQQFTPEYSAVNPKRKVPALVRDDGTTVTEFQAIAFWLARSHPGAGLLAEDLEGQTRAMEVMDFIVASVHMRGFTFVLVPMKFSQNAEFQAEIAAHGKAQIAIGFERLAEILGDQDWLMGGYSIADATLFYITHWATMKGIEMPETIRAHHNRMLDRPAVQRALAGDGATGIRA